MVDYRLRNLARLVVEYCVDLKENEEVSIEGSVESIPFIREIVKQAVQRGAYPIVRITDESIGEAFYKYAKHNVLMHVSNIEREIALKINASISIRAPTHTKPLSGVDPEKLKIRSMATRELMEIFLKRGARGELKWVVVAYPTRALAQEAGMSIEDFEDFVYRATYSDVEDPISTWKGISHRQQIMVNVLSKVKELRLEGPGISLHMRVDGRTWINDDGKVNMPGGEVFTAPLEDSVEGFVEFDFPALWRGVEVDGVKLVFKEGAVVEAKASKNEEFLRRMLETDEGARRVGEFAFGLNYNITRITRDILFDEKIGGTIHIALGSAYPETGGKNISAIHWDMIKSMKNGRVYADGDLIYENGRFIKEVF